MDMGGCMANAINQPCIQEASGRAGSLAGHHTYPGFCFPPGYVYAENLNAQRYLDWSIIVVTCFFQLDISIKLAARRNVYRITVIGTPGSAGPRSVQLDPGIQLVGLLSLLSRCHDRGHQRLWPSLPRDRYLEG